jgi:hypothetical protein
MSQIVCQQRSFRYGMVQVDLCQDLARSGRLAIRKSVRGRPRYIVHAPIYRACLVTRALERIQRIEGQLDEHLNH